MKPLRWALAGLLCLACSIASGDKILLNNGGQLVGIVEQQDSETIAIRTDAGRVTLPRDMVEAIEISARGTTHLQLGESFLRSGQIDKAEAEFRRAMEEPESYRHLRVRMGGWSAYFVMLSRQQQLLLQ